MVKKITIVTLIVIFLSVSVFAGKKEFSKGYWYVTPQLGLNAYALPFGASIEMALKDNIGVGATLMLYFWSENIGPFNFSYTAINPSVDFYYHFLKLKVDKLDVYAGASLGFTIFSYSDNLGAEYKGDLGGGLFLAPFIGAKYMIKDKLAVNFKSYFSAIGGLSGAGAVIGVTLFLKKGK